MIQFVLTEAQVNVEPQPNGLKVVTVTDTRSGIQVVIPLPPDSARTIGASLSTSLYVAGAALKGNGDAHLE